VVLPGFNDVHAHSVWFGMTLLETDLSGVRSLDDVYRIIGDAARDAGAQEWVVASGFNPVLLHGAVPDRDVLDRVAGGRPVWIKHDALAGLGTHRDEPARLGLGAGVRTGWGDDWLQLGPVKVFTDGSILGRTAQLTEAYEGRPGYYGYLQEDADGLRRRVLEAYAAGWSLALHAAGGAALDLALDVIEEGVARFGTRLVPNRVEHGAVVRPDQVVRLAGLGVPCVVQPRFIPAFGEGMRRAIGADRSAWSHRGRSLLDAGLPLAFSSDRPVAAGAPLGGIQAFVERLTEDGLAYGPDERLTAEQAVRAATEGSSQVTGQQGSKGRLVPGQLADMVVLEEHPADVAVEESGSIPVLATMAGGTFTHRQSGW